ncbi:MAG: hypothetical protein AB8F74_03315 [Saprospiraceae bacterium]
MKKKILNCFLLMLFVGFSQTSCFEEPPMLNKKDRKIIDSMYNAQRKEMIVELDSICDLEFDARVQVAVDSIILKRLEEISRLKGPAPSKSAIKIEK